MALYQGKGVYTLPMVGVWLAYGDDFWTNLENSLFLIKVFVYNQDVWRGGRVAEGDGLLNRYTRKRIEGSNPSLSARFLKNQYVFRVIDLYGYRDYNRALNSFYVSVFMKTITALELKKRLDTQEVLLIDVREPCEYKSESIDGACLIPLGEISIDKLPSTKRPIVLHCRSGKRSMDACAKLLASEPSLDVASLEGGIVAWSQAGFPVQKSDSSL